MHKPQHFIKDFWDEVLMCMKFFKDLFKGILVFLTTITIFAVILFVILLILYGVVQLF